MGKNSQILMNFDWFVRVFILKFENICLWTFRNSWNWRPDNFRDIWLSLVAAGLPAVDYLMKCTLQVQPKSIWIRKVINMRISLHCGAVAEMVSAHSRNNLLLTKIGRFLQFVWRVIIAKHSVNVMMGELLSYRKLDFLFSRNS